MFWLLVSSALFVYFVYVIALGCLPEGPMEFSYFPPVQFRLLDPMNGFTFEQLFEHLSRLLIATPILVFFIRFIARRFRCEAPSDRTLSAATIAVGVLSLVYIGLLMIGILRGRAIVDDELTYNMQGKLLSEGRLGYDNVPFTYEGELFTIISKAGVTGKYTPGEPLVQAAGTLVGYPALMHIPIAALTLFLLYRLFSISGRRSHGKWAVILLACSPMFVFTSAHGVSQATSLMCVVAAGVGLELTAFKSPWSGVLLASVGIGFGMLVRPQSMLPFGGVFSIFLIILCLRSGYFRQLSAFVGVLLLFALVIGLYNKALTGSPFVLPWFLFSAPEAYGFGEVIAGKGIYHTPANGFANLFVSLVRFDAWWLGWSSSLILLWLWNRTGRPREHAGPWLWSGFALIVVNFFYYCPGVSDTGPYYYYGLLIPASILGANAIVRGFRKHPALVASLLLVQFGLGASIFYFNHTRRIARLVTEIHADADKAIRSIPKPALVFYEPNRSEYLFSGWLYSLFPRRCRSSSCDVVVYPRPRPEQLNQYLSAYPGRGCWYFRYNPESLQPELLTCRDAVPLFERDVILKNVSYKGRMSTALMLGAGLFDEWLRGETAYLWVDKEKHVHPFHPSVASPSGSTNSQPFQ